MFVYEKKIVSSKQPSMAQNFLRNLFHACSLVKKLKTKFSLKIMNIKN